MKKNGFVIIGIIVFCLIGIVTYKFIFDKNDHNNKSEENKNILADNINIYYEKLKEKRSYLELRNGITADMLLDKNGNVYCSPGVGDIKITGDLANKIKDYSFNDYRSGAGKPYVYKSFKLDISNVLMMYYGEDVIGGITYYVFLKENGTVGVAGFKGIFNGNNFDSFKLDLVYFKENIDGLKNIITVIQNDSLDLYNINLIDIDGNSYRLSDYLK